MRSFFSILSLFLAITLASDGFLLGTASAVIVASDDFQGGTNQFDGGTGWDGNWTSTGGNYLSSDSKIDGTRSVGLYGDFDGGPATFQRLISPTVSTTGTTVSVAFSIRADWDINAAFSGSQIGVNVLNGSSAPLLTFKFQSDGNSETPLNLQLNDGGSDFARSGISFATSAIYDFTFTSDIGSGQYSFTADRRGGSQSDSGTNFNYNNRTTGSIGGLQFFVRAPSGGGNDGFLDSVIVSAVPEPSAFLFGGLVCCVLGANYFRKRKQQKAA